MNRGAWQAIYSSWGRKESDTTERLLPSFQLCERASMGAPTVKDLPANAGDACLIPGLRRLWRRKWQPTPVFLPWKSHRQRSLVGAVCGITKSQT